MARDTYATCFATLLDADACLMPLRRFSSRALMFRDDMLPHLRYHAMLICRRCLDAYAMIDA